MTGERRKYILLATPTRAIFVSCIPADVGAEQGPPTPGRTPFVTVALGEVCLVAPVAVAPWLAE